jgi:hypothetical protein
MYTPHSVLSADCQIPSLCSSCRPTWHCIIGTNFGSHVVHATKHFIYFYLGPKAILLFKSG